MVERERKVDLSKMTIEEADNISIQIGERVRQICDEAAEKTNSILKIYGMSCKIAIAFDTLENKTESQAETPKKRGRKPKKK